jgi:hypothetical protein
MVVATAVVASELVPMNVLVADPAQYHGAHITVSGFVGLPREDSRRSAESCSALFSSREDRDSANFSMAVCLSPHPFIDWSGEIILVEGRFDAEDKGHLGMFAGSIIVGSVYPGGLTSPSTGK